MDTEKKNNKLTIKTLKTFWEAEEALLIEPTDTGRFIETKNTIERVYVNKFENHKQERLILLQAAKDSTEAKNEYISRFGVSGVKKFTSSSGLHVYRLVAETFPGHINNLYYIPQNGISILLDAATDTTTSHRDINRASVILQSIFNEPFSLKRIGAIILTHGHIDHFGGLHWFIRENNADIYVHELDFKTIAQFEERVVLVSKDLSVFLKRAGVPQDKLHEMEEMYRFSKSLFKDLEPKHALKEYEEIFGLKVIHTPGHCPGEVCLKYDDILFTGDHILPTITPHQSPERIAPFCGLSHYLTSLNKVASLDDINLGLGGHEHEIVDIKKRTHDLIAHHMKRLFRILKEIKTPLSTYMLTSVLYPSFGGYNHLLAITETGAHVEYLHDHGYLKIYNLESLLREDNPLLTFCLTKKGKEVLKKGKFNENLSDFDNITRKLGK